MSIEKYFNELTGKKQQEILLLLGDNEIYDIIPIAEIQMDDFKEL